MNFLEIIEKANASRLGFILLHLRRVIKITGGFGGGDVKFMCAAGALLGWRHILWSAAAGIFSAGVYVLYLLIIKNTGRKAEFPLGPFLCLGIAVNILTEIY